LTPEGLPRVEEVVPTAGRRGRTRSAWGEAASASLERLVVEALPKLGPLLSRWGWAASPDELTAVARGVVRDHSYNYGLAAAQVWGEEYWSERGGRGRLQALAEGDWAGLKAAGSLGAFAKVVQGRHRGDRLSAERVDRVCLPLLAARAGRFQPLDDVDWGRFAQDVDILRRFGEDGVEVLVDDEFVPSATAGRISASYAAAPAAVEAHIHKAHLAGVGILLPDRAVRDVGNLNVMNVGLAPKRGKTSGRLTTDASSNAARVGPFLNSEGATARAREAWGAIEHPSLADVIRLVLRAEAQWGRREVVVWKTDLRGAFTLLKFRPSDAALMAARLREGLLFIFVSGNFGWGGMPFAFQVVTRAVLVCVRAVIAGWAVMYCDDLVGVGSRDAWRADREAAVGVFCDLLGSESEAKDKRESSEDGPRRVVVVLGWAIDLESWTVDVSGPNRAKALWVFWAFDPDEPLAIHVWEAVCSLASRYAMVYRELGVLVGDLYGALAGWRGNRHYRARLPEAARVALSLWRARITAAELATSRGDPSGRPLDSFRLRPPEAVLEFDGCLSGVGLRVFGVRPVGEVVLAAVGVRATYDLGADADGSQFQNAMELAAAACALLVTGALGLRGLTVHFRGDSVSALQWLACRNSSFKSARARGAAALVVQAASEFGFVFDESGTHLASADNHVCDDLSRGRVPRADAGLVQWGAVDGVLGGALALCDPRTQHSTEESVLGLWESARLLVARAAAGDQL
jgi:hypothetical protein